MADFEPVLSRNWDVPDAHTLKVYESRGGYQAARKAITEMDPDKVIGVVKDSELRGRGGAGFPTGLKWSFLPKDRTETFMCINADESEPATFNNRRLMENDPHQLLEGIHDRLLRHQGGDGLHLRPVRVHPRVPAARSGGRRGSRGGASGQEHLRDRVQPRYPRPPGGWGLHLRRGDGADREPGREARAGRGSSRRSRRSRGPSASRRSSTTSRR